MARNGIICSILIVYVMVVMPATGQYCPKDINPIVEDQANCTFQIHNDTTAVHNLLQMVVNWKYESIQVINIPIIISLNDTELTSHHRIRLHEWVMRNIDPDRPLYQISWRADFKVLSFGLLNEVHSNPEFTLGIEETEGACTFQYGSESTTREIVRTVLNYIRKSKLLDKTNKYENINMCFLSVFDWFKNSDWYTMKQYFGIPFQEFGYKCCKLYNQTVCCNDKLYNINGYHLIPYIISVLLICYAPVILIKLAKINHTFHPNYYRDFGNIPGNDRQQDSPFMSMFDNIFCINTKNEKNCFISCVNRILCNVCNDEIIDCVKSRVARLLFVFLLPCGIYFEFIMFSFSKDWKPVIEDIDRENVLFGFTPMLVNVWNNKFLYPIGPSIFLIIYYGTGIIILVLPYNFEETVVKGGLDKIRDEILEKLPQQIHENLPGYIQLERVLKCMFMICSCTFWKTLSCCKFMIMLLFFLPLFPFTLIIFIGYARYVISKLRNKGNTGVDQNKIMDENNKDIGTEHNQTTNENTQDIGTEQNQTTDENTQDIGTEQNQTTDENNEGIGTEQNQTTDINTPHIGTDNNARCGGQCKCKPLFMKFAYCCCLLLLPVFAYTFAIIVSYTVYIIVYVFYFMWWALVTSPTETAGLLIFVSGGIVFAYKIVKDGISFYKELFNLTIDVCQQNEGCTKNKYLKLENGIIYIKKDIVRKVQQDIYPLYISIGYTIMKLIAVIFLYISYFLVIMIYSLNTGTNDNFNNVTMVITSALPTLVASQFKHKLPNKNIVTHIVNCYLEENVNVEKGAN